MPVGPIGREQQKLQANRDELIERVDGAIRTDGRLEIVPGFFLARSSRPMESVESVYEPSFCIVVRGSKKVLLGDEVFSYDPGHYLIFTVDLPVVFQVEEASEDRPYLGCRLTLDPSLVASVMTESGVDAKNVREDVKAINVSSVTPDLLDAILRLVRLADVPQKEREFIAPLIVREIVFRLLVGGQGGRLSHLVAPGRDTHRVSQAIGYLRENFNQPLRMDELAQEFGMSLSSFHHHFKSVTAMSPLQFQKRIRLQEARRLMLGEQMDAANAGFRVGYEDPAYFSRLYKELFGDPPQRDISRLRNRLEA